MSSKITTSSNNPSREWMRFFKKRNEGDGDGDVVLTAIVSDDQYNESLFVAHYLSPISLISVRDR